MIVNINIVCVAGDLGQTYNSLSTLEHCMQTGAQSILFVGDLSYADRYDNNDVGIRWDSWGRFVEQSAAYQPWIWSAGNHEIEYFPHLVKCHTNILNFFMSYLHSRKSFCEGFNFRLFS